LIGLGRYDDAEKLYENRWDKAMLYRLGTARQQAELLELLFPDGLDKLPRLSTSRAQSYLGRTLAARGKEFESAKALDRSIELALQGVAYKSYDDQTMRALWFGVYAEAQVLAYKAMDYCQQGNFGRGMIRAARLQGEAALGLGDLATAVERLHYALARARTVNLVEEELPALIGLAELKRRQGDLKAARELLDDVWEGAERGPFRLFHADALNVLAQIERDEGLSTGMVRWATFRLSLGVAEGEGAFSSIGDSGTDLAAIR
jgi:hypothetical protein